MVSEDTQKEREAECEAVIEKVRCALAKNSDGGIYEHAANSMLALYADFVEGDANCTLIVVSARRLTDTAQAALEASAQRLGYGREAIAWVVCGAEFDGSLQNEACDETVADSDDTASTSTLSPFDLIALIEGLDPVGIVATDTRAKDLLEKGYGVFEAAKTRRISGREVVIFDSFESMLNDDQEKQRAWHALKKLAL